MPDLTRLYLVNLFLALVVHYKHGKFMTQMLPDQFEILFFMNKYQAKALTSSGPLTRFS